MTAHSSVPPNFIFAHTATSGLNVLGTHSDANAPTPSAWCEGLREKQLAWRKKVLSRPGGFDGERAVLMNWSVAERGLELSTAYRSYTEGRALRDLVVDAIAQKQVELPGGPLSREQQERSWGLALACVVLLPNDHVLCSKRALTLAVNPGLWACTQTEVVEPKDMHEGGMQALLDRAVAEEMPAFKGRGTHRFVGLGQWSDDGGWALVSVLDLTGMSSVSECLGLLEPDAETQAWAAAPLATPFWQGELPRSAAGTEEAASMQPFPLQWGLVQAMKSHGLLPTTSKRHQGGALH